MVADNNDINEETIDRKNTTHATTLIVYQRKQYGPMPPRQIHANHSQKRRSLDSAINTLAIEEVSLCGRRAPPTIQVFWVKSKWNGSNAIIRFYLLTPKILLGCCFVFIPPRFFKKALVWHYLSRAFQAEVGFILVFSPRYQ